MNARFYLDIGKGYVHLKDGHIYEDMQGRYFKVKRCKLPYYKFGCAEQIPSPKFPDIVEGFDDHWTEDGISYHNDCGLNLICEVKWDSYYEEYIPYKMCLDVLYARAMEHVEKDTDRANYRDRDVLAYIRERGDKFRCLARSATRGMMSPLGLMVSSDDEEMVLCRHYSDKKRDREGSYNPLIEKDSIREDHWYHPYKIMLTPVEFDGCIDKYYFSDFVSMLDEGHIEIWEPVEEEVNG